VKKISIVFEDKGMLAINKPTGMIVNRAATTKNILTVEDWLEETDRGRGVTRNGIVHRLDKDTSGIMLIAKTEEGLVKLQSQFKKREINKEYQTLVHGTLQPMKGRILAPITRSPFNRQRFGVFIGGKRAETKYEVVAYYSYLKEMFSLVKAKPITGRTHQIRVHLKHLNHPVVGDEWYGGRKTYKRDIKWCGRLWLQASKISFVNPTNNKFLSLKLKLDPELQDMLNLMQKD
jgi:23S rRNA pseudouridine1911/1915/1917 synthase